MASASVGSPMTSCQCSTGTWLVTMVERAAVAIVDDFEQVAALLGGQRGEPPIVEDEQVDAGDAGQQASVAAVAAGERERLEQPRQPVIEDGAIVAAGLVAERAGDPALAHPGRADDQQVQLALDPVAGDEAGEQGSVEAARGARDRYPRRRPGAAARRTSAGWRGTCSAVRRPRGRACRARRSSNGSAATSGWRRWSSKALAMPVRPRAIRRSRVGWVSMGGSCRQW